jgi:hypothetical protein
MGSSLVRDRWRLLYSFYDLPSSGLVKNKNDA